MHYFDNYRLLKQCYFDEKYSGRKKIQKTSIFLSGPSNSIRKPSGISRLRRVKSLGLAETPERVSTTAHRHRPRQRPT